MPVPKVEKRGLCGSGTSITIKPPRCGKCAAIARASRLVLDQNSFLRTKLENRMQEKLSYECKKCNGTGRISWPQNGVQYSTECPSCRGYGYNISKLVEYAERYLGSVDRSYETFYKNLTSTD